MPLHDTRQQNTQGAAAKIKVFLLLFLQKKKTLPSCFAHAPQMA
jgi:hypothetical protein